MSAEDDLFNSVQSARMGVVTVTPWAKKVLGRGSLERAQNDWHLIDSALRTIEDKAKRQEAFAAFERLLDAHSAFVQEHVFAVAEALKPAVCTFVEQTQSLDDKAFLAAASSVFKRFEGVSYKAIVYALNINPDVCARMRRLQTKQEE